MNPAGGGNAPQIQTLWAQTVEQIKKDIIAPGLWRALERTVAIAWEDEWFVIGMVTSEGHLASQLQTTDYRNAIERVLQRLTGDANLKFRVIEGNSYDDWAFTKAKDAAAANKRQQTAQKQYREASAFGSWDEVYEQVSRLWASLPGRSLAFGKARFLDQALALTSKAMEGLMPDMSKTDEQQDRGLSRVVERIANTVGSDPTVVAYLLMERCRQDRE